MRKKLIFTGLILLIGGALVAGIADFGALANGNILDDGEQGTDSDSREIQWSFAESSARAGLDYTYANGSSSDGEQGMMAEAGDEMVTNAGVYANDYDKDGWTDVLAIGGSEPVLFRNTGGEFEPSGALPALDREVEGALFFDHDGDGWADLLVLSNDEKPLLLENVDGEFHKRDAGFNRTLPQPVGATTADYDQDGCSDLYIIQNGNWSNNLPEGIAGYNAPLQEDNGNPNHLYQGSCGSFERADDAGIRGTRWSLATSFADFNDDGRPDLHVANDFNHDVVYVNHPNSTFRQVVLPEATNRNGMSSELADVNRDGRLDIFVTNFYLPTWAGVKKDSIYKYKANGNNLLINQGGSRFEPSGREYGVAAGGWGWAAIFADFDNDADNDLFHTTSIWDVGVNDPSFSRREVDKLHARSFYSYSMVRRYENGTFHEVSPDDIGLEVTDGRGAARLDYNRDGAVDIVVATKSSYRLYENTADVGNAIQFQIENSDGTLAEGSNVSVTAANETQRRHVSSNTDFLSQDSAVVHVGVGNAENVDVRVAWPDGSERTFEDVRTGQRLVIDPSGVSESVPLSNQSEG